MNTAEERELLGQIDDLEKEVAELERQRDELAKHRWIPVKPKHHPKICQEIIAKDINFPAKQFRHWASFGINSKRDYDDLHKYYTHWMPIPPLPKEQANG